MSKTHVFCFFELEENGWISKARCMQGHLEGLSYIYRCPPPDSDVILRTLREVVWPMQSKHIITRSCEVAELLFDECERRGCIIKGPFS
jgi:hypothetical protein